MAAKNNKRVRVGLSDVTPLGKNANDMESDGEQYHIGLKRGDIANQVILCGELERVSRVSSFFNRVRVKKQRREFITVTGDYLGLPISVMGTGIGPDNTEIALVEAMRLMDLDRAVFIRVGSCGSLQEKVRLGDAVISTASVRLENTSLFYVPEGYPAVAHHDVVRALIDSAKATGLKAHTGLTATAPSFYGAQGRETGYHLRFPGIINELSAIGVLNLEMEASALFTLCSLKGVRAGAICAAYTDRIHDTVISKTDKERADRLCVLSALGALTSLARYGTGKSPQKD